MKKLLAILSLALFSFSFQANAAPLKWDSVPVGSLTEFVINTGSGTDALLGIGLFSTTGTNINHTWDFEVLNSTTPVKVEITDIPDGWLSSASFLFNGHNLLSSAWTGFLAAGIYQVNLQGITDALNQSYSLRVSVSSVPVPAAVWLFGSALVGLAGAKRRKVVA